jgi:stress response protein SCP2
MVKGTSLALPHGYYDNKVVYDTVGKFQIEQPDNKILQKSQNIPVNNLLNTEISLNFDYLSNNLSLSVVPYAFILDENDAVATSDGFVYPNTSSPNDAVYCAEKAAKIKLNLLPKETQKVIIVYTISGTENLENSQNNLNFNKIHLPNLKIMAEGELYYNFPLRIDDSSTLIAVEFYQTRNGWRLNAVGAEYNAPFSELCAECGIKLKK